MHPAIMDSPNYSVTPNNLCFTQSEAGRDSMVKGQAWSLHKLMAGLCFILAKTDHPCDKG